MPRPEAHLGEQWEDFVQRVRQNPSGTFPETKWDLRKGPDDAIIAQFRYVDTHQNVSKVLGVALRKDGRLTLDPGRKQRQRHSPTLTICSTSPGGVGVVFTERVPKDGRQIELEEILLYGAEARLKSIIVCMRNNRRRKILELGIDGHVLQTGIHHPSADLGLQTEDYAENGPVEFWLKRRNRVGPKRRPSRKDKNWLSTELQWSRWGGSELARYISPEFPYEASPIALMEMVREKIKATIGEHNLPTSDR